MAKHVCIIGAGPSGLVAAKTLLYNAPAGAFKVTIYEAQKRIGGLWPSSKDDGDGLVHPLMITNQSKHTMHFSDFSWEPEDPQFPRAWMVGRYLERYLGRYPGVDVQLGHRVVKTDQLDGDRWNVTVRSDTGEEKSSVFDHLVVTTGFFGNPIIPDVVPAQPAVPVLHTSKYRDLQGLLGSGSSNGGKILIVGGQMSGVETAGTIANHLSSAVNSPEPSQIQGVEKYTIHHLIQRPSWIFPLFTSPKPAHAAAPFFPVDLGSYNLNNRVHPLTNTQGHIAEEAAVRTHGIFQATLGSDQSMFAPSVAVSGDDTMQPAYLAMSENYTEFVRSGLISVTRGKLESLEGSSAILQVSGERIDNVAAVILATGFDASACVSFLPDAALKTLDFKPEHKDFPLALGFHGTQHHGLPTLGFVGFYRSPYWGIMEMQARFLAALWTPESFSPQPPGLAAALQDTTDEERTKALREDPRRSQFPMGDYAFIMQEISAALNLAISPPPEPATPPLPHNKLPLNILSPSRYLSPLADDAAKAENATLLKMTNDAAIAGLTTPRFVAHAVFRSLLGTWKLERSLDSKLPSHPSGHFSGTARFLLRDATADGLKCVSGSEGQDASTFLNEGDTGMEYLYIEEGKFRADNGLEFQAKRRYVWRYDEGKDRLSVWFVRTDDDKRADYLFHEVEFEGPAPDEGGGALRKGWKAKAGHLCIDDFYNVAYEFSFRAVNLEEWSIAYDVKGPKKDYAIRGVYRR